MPKIATGVYNHPNGKLLIIITILKSKKIKFNFDEIINGKEI